jgi:glycolate oxidase
LLAVITEVTVKLTPKAPDAKCVLAAFDDVSKASAAVAAIIAAGIVPSGLEMMDRLTIAAVEPFVHAGYPGDAEAILLCESDGVSAEVDAEVEIVRGLMASCGATLVDVSTSDEQRERFWSGRKAAFGAAGRISPAYYCIDGTIPRRTLAPVLKRIAELSAEFGLPCMNVFHAGDGNLHPLILYDPNRAGDAEKTQAFGAKDLRLSIEVGGTITGEHGVGVEKLGEMCIQFAKPELERFHGVKRAFDPDALLNPGKAVPTLHRCAEMGRMHVHHGALPHPELPRF